MTVLTMSLFLFVSPFLFRNLDVLTLGRKKKLMPFRLPLEDIGRFIGKPKKP